jgi:hypothetical protein
MKMTQNSHFVMFFIMILSGLLSTMNVWVDKPEDIRFSLNDVYMILLMTGWMFFFMGLYYKETRVFLFGTCLVILNFLCIRTQFMVSHKQFLLGMIPHHSMAVHMSKKLLEKERPTNNPVYPFLKNIVKTQSEEIEFMKRV